LLEIVLLAELLCNEIQMPLLVSVLFETVILEELYNTSPSERCQERVLFEMVLPLKFSNAIPAPLVTVFLISTFLMTALDQFLR